MSEARTKEIDVENSSKRVFCDELEQELRTPMGSSESKKLEIGKETIKMIQNNIIGRNQVFQSPFGPRSLLYADFTASSKPLACIEEYIRDNVLPFYANTHTTTSITGLQSTCFRHEARQIIAQSVNAKISGRGSEDCVLFTGSGSTSAVSKIITAMGLSKSKSSSNNQRPVVFLGPHEHHSNLLPWRESSAEVVMVPSTAEGDIDISKLETLLIEFADRPLKIGSFSAASNITGLLANVNEITYILHKHGALSFWDYAACAPYVPIDMNPMVSDETRRPFVYKDAIFFSGHKFIGGVNSPGVLVAKKWLLAKPVPSTPGGGTVFYVTKDDHRYLSNKAEREEGGTPDIVGSIRLGLAFQLKERVGRSLIATLESRQYEKVQERLRQNPKIVLMGNGKASNSLPIFSFLVKCQSRFLHYNFVCALLNDLFGIQTRGGCQCAGPYGQELLGISRENNLSLEASLIDKKEILRPGFTRFSVPYFMASEEVDYILDSIDFVAEFGHKFLPLYKFNHKTGEWKHPSRFTKFPNRMWLSDFKFTLNNSSSTINDSQGLLQANLDFAYELVNDDSKVRAWELRAAATDERIFTEDQANLRWFAFASDLKKPSDSTTSVLGPIQPLEYDLEQEEKEKEKIVEPVEPMEDVGVMTSILERISTTDKEEPEHKVQEIVQPEMEPEERESSTRVEGGKYPLRVANECDEEESPFAMSFHVEEGSQKMSRRVRDSVLFPTVPKKIMSQVGKAMVQWNMIQNGDRLLLGLSGGKDSLALLHVLYQFQKKGPIQFELAAATVDPQTESFDPSPLKDYMKSLNIPYFYLSDNIIERAACELEGDSLCSYCSRMKRGMLYNCCRREGYNKLVLAQHLDDLAESFMMSIIYNGCLRTMKANFSNDKGDVHVIRPLIYVREDLTKEFAYDARLPIINENCPACFEEPKERQRVKKLLFQEESISPNLYNSLRAALIPLMHADIYGPIQEIRDTIDRKRCSRVKAKKKLKE